MAATWPSTFPQEYTQESTSVLQPRNHQNSPKVRPDENIHGKPRFYRFCRYLCRFATAWYWRIRSSGAHHLPLEGGMLVLANHQSVLDPVMIGVCTQRQLTYLARKTLFRGPGSWLIESLNAIPIDRDGFGLAGLKETLRRLKRDEAVLIFPEGTRSRDGEVQRLLPGFVALARRGKVPLLPVAVDGAYHSWPRGSKFPRRATVQVEFGEPIPPEELDKYTDEELRAEVERRIRELHQLARQKRLQRNR